MSPRYLLLAMALVMAGPAASATRNGDPDPNFGLGGLAVVDAGEDGSGWVALARYPDGRLVLAGNYDGGATGVDFVAAMLDRDGNLLPGFGVGGLARMAVGPGDSTDSLREARLLPDGRILLFGSAASPQPGNSDDMVVVCLNADGTLDGSFGDGGKVFLDFGPGGAGGEEYAGGFAVQPDGKVVVAGSTWTYEDGQAMAVARLNPDGSLDATFGSGGMVKIHFGSADAMQYTLASAVKIDSQGRIVLAGAATDADVLNVDFAVARLLENGQLDPGFSEDGRQTVAFDVEPDFADMAYHLALGSDDSVTLVGLATTADAYDMAAVHLQADGSPMPGFGDGGRIVIPFDPEGAPGLQVTTGALWYGERLILVGTGHVHMEGGPEQATLLVGVDSRGELDPDFGTGGKRVLANPIGGHGMASTAGELDGGRLLLPSLVATSDNRTVMAVQAVVVDVLFSDGHEGD